MTKLIIFALAAVIAVGFIVALLISGQYKVAVTFIAGVAIYGYFAMSTFQDKKVSFTLLLMFSAISIFSAFFIGAALISVGDYMKLGISSQYMAGLVSSSVAVCVILFSVWVANLFVRE